MLVLYYGVLFAIFKKPIAAIEDTQHYPCLNSCLAARCMKYCYAILSKLLKLSQYLNYDVYSEKQLKDIWIQSHL